MSFSVDLVVGADIDTFCASMAPGIGEFAAVGKFHNGIAVMAVHGVSSFLQGGKRHNIVEPVSYTHLDVYKRQILQIWKKNFKIPRRPFCSFATPIIRWGKSGTEKHFRETGTYVSNIT